MATRLLIEEETGATPRVAGERLTRRSAERVQFIDVTESVRDLVRRSGVRHGLVSVQTHHTTTGIVVNENEPLLLADLKALLERLAPSGSRYAHNDLSRRVDPAPDESANGDAHCRALLLGSSESLSVVDGELILGAWQRVFFVELDGPRTRTLSILVVGVSGSGQ